ncbi:thiamine pyrophosphokinase [Aspergillus pseudodeflectus]|uniref:Thiamine pyrophosphokinase n=1 Tax=Aspergillus pseudodeflectus TaxID=176178 RepID=A0ABR4KD61_9EURO
MEWDPTQFFREEENKTPPPFALVVLNQPINEIALSVLREHALTIVCADGGANRFFESAKSRGVEGTDIPDTIIGDLDSIRPEIRTHYANLGVNIVHDDDQYSTDFTKSLRYLRKQEERILSSYAALSSKSTAHHPIITSDLVSGERRRLEILILGGLGGRVDQAFSQIHHLYMMDQEQSTSISGSGADPNTGHLYLISEASITFILQPGPNTIHVPRTNRPHTSTASKTDSPNAKTHQLPAPREEGEEEEEDHLLEENVGIIPLSGPARITTSGFQWDVEDWATEIGGQISTSNHIRAEVVHVHTDVPVLFTVELARRLKRVSR